ncbi:hypothetical protein FHW71_003924 [Enterobacter sp. Sphag1F]|jgi:hypothetical protein|nr:hypothetical protein [Enterobacter sp. Sphag1F]NYI16059.1 hypothetical protein [Enterobacter sp. Sphag71]
MATLQNRVIILMRIPTVGSSFMTTFPITARYFPGRHKWRPYKSHIQTMNHVHKLMYAAVNFPQAA